VRAALGKAALGKAIREGSGTCREAGFEVVEVNASDTRNKSDSKIKEGIAGKLSNRVKELVTNTAISLGGTQQQRQVLVMDEVDGMSGAPPPTPHVCMCAALWVCTCAALVVRSAGSARQLAHRRLYTALWLCSASER
jgi:hypothetical protein